VSNYNVYGYSISLEAGKTVSEIGAAHQRHVIILAMVAPLIGGDGTDGGAASIGHGTRRRTSEPDRRSSPPRGPIAGGPRVNFPVPGRV